MELKLSLYDLISGSQEADIRAGKTKLYFMILNLISNGVREEIHSEMWRIDLTIRPSCLMVYELF